MGTFQNEDVGPHVHEIETAVGPGGGIAYPFASNNSTGYTNIDTYGPKEVDGLETRPKNITVNTFIKIN